MLDEYTEVQPMADRFKHLLYRGGVSQSKIKQTLRLINKFERCGWQSRAMQMALDEVAPKRFTLKDGDLVFTPVGADDEDVATYVQRVIRRYAELIEYSLFGEVMGIEDAALYLEMSAVNLKKALHVAGTLHGSKIGHDWAFTKTQLEAFRATKRSRGRQPQKAVEE